MAAAAPSPTLLQALADLGSTRADLFLPLAKSPDPILRKAALTGLTATPRPAPAPLART